MKRTFSILALSAATCASPLFAAAEFVPLQQLAEGQSLTGSNLLNDSLYVNPAASAFTNVYSIDGTYELSKRYAVSVLDTKNGTVDGALGYFRTPVADPNGNNYGESLQGVKGALSGRLSSSLAIGIAGKALWGPRASSGQHDKLNDGDIGVLANLGIVQLGATVYNVLGGNLELDKHQGREYSIGGRIGYQDLIFLSVATTSSTKTTAPYQYGIGAEYVSPYYFSLKGGYRILTDDHLSYWSAGVGINSPRVSVSYGVQFPQSNSESIEHVLGVMILL